MTTLILPGLSSSGPQHWQSRWEAIHPGVVRVEQDEWDAPRCIDWLVRLDEALRLHGDDVVVAAHSTACALVAHWATAHPGRRLRGALLVAPSDPEGAHYPKEPSGFAPVPMKKISFPTVVVASRNDDYVTIEKAGDYAAAWGSRLVDIGEAGHINSASGLGDWPEGWTLLQQLQR